VRWEDEGTSCSFELSYPTFARYAEKMNILAVVIKFIIFIAAAIVACIPFEHFALELAWLLYGGIALLAAGFILLVDRFMLREQKSWRDFVTPVLIVWSLPSFIFFGPIPEIILLGLGIYGVITLIAASIRKRTKEKI
jgi:hypothetical protein